jgi:polysaccharide biosynthesis protein PslH
MLDRARWATCAPWSYLDATVKEQLKQWLFGLLGKHPEAIVVSFRSGDDALADAMCAEIRRLEPSRRHFEVRLEDAHDVARLFRGYRIGLAPVLFTGDPKYRPLRIAAARLAPRKILAYNARLERHHLRLTQPVASWLFVQGLPLDRIFLRPAWLWPWRKDRTTRPSGHRVIEGRTRREGRPAVAVLTPYFPFPLAHGGAVRIFHLLREIAREFDVILYAFSEGEISEGESKVRTGPARPSKQSGTHKHFAEPGSVVRASSSEDADLRPVLRFATRVYLVDKPRYREPRWSTLWPPEACEYQSPAMRALWSARVAEAGQVEYTYLAPYGGDILVEHDVTWDLYEQVRARKKTLSSWWDWKRWKRFEDRAIRRFPWVVTMSEKDRQLLGIPNARVVENGVDLERFQPAPEAPGRRLLFIGSFRHFPNVVAFRFLTEEILPLTPDVELTVVAGPDPWPHWRNVTGTLQPPPNPRVRILEFVADVCPLYRDTNVVVVTTLESAGTNVKVLEALAMERAVVSTPSGCAGLGLKHLETAWIADSAEGLAEGIRALLDDGPGNGELRAKIAQAGREHARKHFDWKAIGRRQRALLREKAGDPLLLRPAGEEDLDAIMRIQAASPETSQWERRDWLGFDCTVAVWRADNAVAGVLLSRQTAHGEREVLNLAVAPAARRKGVALRLLEHELERGQGSWFLEVRESNTAAIALYEGMGFRRVGRRKEYYLDPSESGIVMRFLS